MRKYIQMLTSTWDLSYLTSLVKGITRRLKSEDISLHIFNAYDEIYEQDYYEQGRSIFSIPNDSNYIGAIAVFNSVDSTHILADQVAGFTRLGIPVVSIDQHADGAAFFGLDNYKSMYHLVEHMITVHGCRTLNYIGGPADNEENLLRFKAFSDCLNSYGIEPEPMRVRHYRFVVEDGEIAYNYFKNLDLHLPDAVICANDGMAYGYCLAAAKDGFYAPNDFRITGFDNIEQAQNYLPSITSVNRSWEQLGFDAANGLMDLINNGQKPEGEFFTEGFVRINESCGCNTGLRNLKDDYMGLLDKLSYERQNTQKLYDVRKSLLSSPKFNNFRQSISRSCDILEIPEYAVCLSENFYRDEYGNVAEQYVGTVRVLMAGSVTDIDTAVTLLPPAFEKSTNDVYIFSSLHFGQVTFGYCVMPFDYELVSSGGHRNLMDNLALALINIKQHMFLDMMNDKLRSLYVQDTLTGLYNRFGFRDLSASFFEENNGCIFVVYADLDNLKTINDKYGHNYGDKAIIALADALKDAFREEDIKIRMGGDEFIVIGSYLNDWVLDKYREKIDKYLAKVSKDSDFPVVIQASIAYASNNDCTNGLELETLVHEADQRMYEIKEQHHKKRAQANPQ